MTTFTINPHVTERTTTLANRGTKPAYTFVVESDLNKPAIKKAFFARYQVKATRVAVITVSPRRIVYRGRPGRRPGFKKAIISVPAGQKIDFV